jgi:hypothetical protein
MEVRMHIDFREQTFLENAHLEARVESRIITLKKLKMMYYEGGRYMKVSQDRASSVEPWVYVSTTLLLLHPAKGTAPNF